MTPAKDSLRAARQWMDTTEALVNSAPGADDLEASSVWVQHLSAAYARWAQLNGECETVYARLVQKELAEISEEEFKRIKGSSTLTEKWVQGRYYEQYSVVSRMASWGRAMSEIMQNTRTLLASWRQEREFEIKTQVKNN